jgi:hypothetical protein
MKTSAGKQPTDTAKGRPAEERFHLHVDGQAKRSFSSLDEAVAAGRQIKKDFPIVTVTVMDAEDGSSHPVTV